ncbi:MAG TPA: VanZ family protein [Sedimentisphaerales bacterium]|nr:VanZ family protein [Sedimentisphaerales bacterium]
MALSHRQKLIIISLLIYWPVIFVLAHVPIPQLVRKAGVSDKILHFIAYLVLVFLLWFTVSPDMKVNWRRAAAWWVLLITVWYGVVDEVLQSFVAGRSCDVMDFFADLAGVVTGLILFTLFTFWPAFLVVTGITIFAMTNLARTSLADLLPAANVAFHLFAYAFFATLWIHNMHLFLPIKARKLKWLIVASALPIGFLLAVTSFSIISGRVFRLQDTIIAAVGITAVVITIYLTSLFHRRSTQKLSPK